MTQLSNLNRLSYLTKNLNLKFSQFLMKSRTKSIKDNLTMDTSKRKKSSECKNSKKNLNTKTNSHEDQTKKYLLKTLNLLQTRLKLKPVQKPTNIFNLSSAVYHIVKNNVHATISNSHNTNNHNHSTFLSQPPKSSNAKHSQSKNQNQSHYHSKMPQNCPLNLGSFIGKANNGPGPVKKGNSSCLDVSQIHKQNCLPAHVVAVNSRRRSNSTLDEYFKDKFGSCVQDQQAVQKKLRVIKALKKSQQIVNKTNRSQIQNSSSNINCEMNDKQMVMQKLKHKSKIH